MNIIQRLTDIRVVSFSVLAIGCGVMIALERWVGVGMLVFSWGSVQIIQIGIDKNTRWGEVWGTSLLLAVCAGFYHFPALTALVAVLGYCGWIVSIAEW